MSYVMKTLNIFTLPSTYNISVPEKVIKLLTLNSMTFIHQNKHYHVTCVQYLDSLVPTYDLPLINIDIPGYNFLYVTPSTNAGGVGIYVSDNLILTSLKTTIFLLVLVKNR